MATLAQLFAEGYSIGEAIPRQARARAAARERFGAAADDPELFGALQQLEFGQNQEKRAQAGEVRAQAAETRAQGTYDFNMGEAKQNKQQEATLSLVNGLRSARASGQDLGSAFDKLVKSLPELGIDPGDLPDMRAKLLENPKILDDYYAALTSGTPLSAAAAKTAAAAQESRDAAASEMLKLDDMLERIDLLDDPEQESAGRAVFGLPTPGKTFSGGFGTFGSVPGSSAANYVNQLEALKADIRSNAFETLKGGGSITEKESQFAADAIARLERTSSFEQFKQELARTRKYMGALRDAAKRRMGGESVADITTAGGVQDDAIKTNRIYPGFIKDGWRFKGGAPSDKNNWEQVK